MNNTTLINLSKEIQIHSSDNYDSIGAIVFTVVVLLWYSLSIIFLLGMETIKPSGFVPDSYRHSKKLFTRNFHEKTHNKNVLEELADRKKRDRLWNIYLGTSRNENDKISQAEKLRIRNIRRQLATIHEHHRNDTERLQSFQNKERLESEIGSSAPNFLEIEDRARIRRQSEVDQQILEEWQKSIDVTRVNENWPWAIQKLMIRRQLRRQKQDKDCENVRKLSIS